MALPNFLQPDEAIIKAKYPVGSIWQTREGTCIRILSHVACPYWTPEPTDSLWAYAAIVRYDLRAEDWVFDGSTEYFELCG